MGRVWVRKVASSSVELASIPRRDILDPARLGDHAKALKAAAKKSAKKWVIDDSEAEGESWLKKWAVRELLEAVGPNYIAAFLEAAAEEAGEE